MKRYLASFTAIAAGVLLLNQPLAAQEKEKDKDKSKLSENEEIIIKKKSDKDSKFTVEIKNGEVTVNGKPIDEFDDENVVVKKERSSSRVRIASGSPFRGGAGNSVDFYEGHPPGESTSAFLGVVSEKTEKGIKVEDVTNNSAAEKAGIKPGDIITKIDDDVITTPDVLTKVIRKHKPEDKVTIYYEREGKADKVTATLGKRVSVSVRTYGSANLEDMPQLRAMPDMNMNFDWDDSRGHRLLLSTPKPRLGIKAQDTEDGKGVKVLDVDDESAAAKAGVKEDDIITEFDGKKVNSADELAAAAREAKEKPSVKVAFNRSGKSQTVEIKTPRKLKTANL